VRLLPRPLRRALLGPSILVATLLVITTLPLWLIGAAFASPRLPGRLRPLRILSFVLVVLVVESLALVGLLVLWVAQGLRRPPLGERSRVAHYGLMRLYLAAVFWSARRVFNLDFTVDAGDAHPTPLDLDAALHEGEQVRTADATSSSAPRELGAVRWLRRLGRRGHPVSSGRFRVNDEDRRTPLLVFSRHAGPGDSLLLVHALLQQGFRPHIVLRDVLQWAPALDVALNRLPSVFLSSRVQGQRERIARLAGGLGPGDALLLFPEGRNFTVGRRMASIARLEELGDHAAAEHAREMRHVLIPRPGGAVAAVCAAVDAEVVFIAHTGLEDLSSVVDLWRGTPMDASIRVKLWRVAAQDVPRDADEAAQWLLGWWRRIDEWILEHHGQGALPDAAVRAVQDGPDQDGPDEGGDDTAVDQG
jgi:1-acyl-sn-glycerol-3-phosphate acyltransferase